MTNSGNQDRRTVQDQLGPPPNQTTGTPSASRNQESSPGVILPVIEPVTGTTRVTVTRAEDLQRTLFNTPHMAIPETGLSDPPNAPV